MSNIYLLTHIIAANISNFMGGNPATKYENACSTSSSFSFCLYKWKHISLCRIQTGHALPTLQQ